MAFRRIILPFFCFFILQQSFAGDSTEVYAVLKIKGLYQGKNLYVQNPFREDVKTFCTQKVIVNGIQVHSYMNASAYEIDLSTFHLQDSLSIEIHHHKSCKPKIMNPSMHPPVRTMWFRKLQAVGDSIVFQTKHDTKKSTFYLEQFLYNTWETTDSINSVRKDSSRYVFKPSYHSGTNKIRIRNMDKDGMIAYSAILEVPLPALVLKCGPTRVEDTLKFNYETAYELLDRFGKRVMAGKGSFVNMNELLPGVYYLNADNQTKKVFKK